LLSLEHVVTAARRARAQGATRFCMGAAWRVVRDGSDKFERVLEIVHEVSQLGMEVCVTLGEIGLVEARKLKAAGVTAHNQHIDTSPQFFYGNKLLTAKNPAADVDVALLRELGLRRKRVTD